MKALVVGCGSIGRRHIDNLLKLDDIEEIVICSKISDCDRFFERSNKKVSVISDLNLIKDRPDFAVICNETNRHLITALSLAEKGIDLFIEKPISHSLDGVQEFRKAVLKNKLNVFVGYNLRFLGALNEVKKIIARGDIGDLYFARIEAGQYLPQWRKNIDYRQCYSAFKEKGGGVSLDISHEIDYMRFLFGEPLDWNVVKGRVSGLEIDSDDIFEGIYVFKNFICSVHLDYLQLEKKRGLFIAGSKGSIGCDIANEKILVKYADRESSITDKKYFDISQTYIDELKLFVSHVKDKSGPKLTFDDAVKVLQLIEAKDV